MGWEDRRAKGRSEWLARVPRVRGGKEGEWESGDLGSLHVGPGSSRPATWPRLRGRSPGSIDPTAPRSPQMQ